MRNIDFKQNPMERADMVYRAYEGLSDLLCGREDLHIVDPENLGALIDVLNRELALSLRDAFAEARGIVSREAHRRLAAEGALIDPKASPREAA